MANIYTFERCNIKLTNVNMDDLSHHTVPLRLRPHLTVTMIKTPSNGWEAMQTSHRRPILRYHEFTLTQDPKKTQYCRLHRLRNDIHVLDDTETWTDTDVAHVFKEALSHIHPLPFVTLEKKRCIITVNNNTIRHIILIGMLDPHLINNIVIMRRHIPHITHHLDSSTAPPAATYGTDTPSAPTQMTSKIAVGTQTHQQMTSIISQLYRQSYILYYYISMYQYVTQY